MKWFTMALGLTDKAGGKNSHGGHGGHGLADKHCASSYLYFDVEEDTLCIMILKLHQERLVSSGFGVWGSRGESSNNAFDVGTELSLPVG
jgi:hypothetical protein